MSLSLAFSTLSLLSLLVFFIFSTISVISSRFYNLACSSTMSKYLNLMAIHLKWACNWLSYGTGFSRPRHAHGVPESRGEELISTARYEHNPCSSEVECAVCLCKIENGDEIRELRCDHLFHRVCLERWLGYKNLSCPLCRDSLAPFRAITELGVEVLSFKIFSFSSSDRETWWLRWIKWCQFQFFCQSCNALLLLCMPYIERSKSESVRVTLIAWHLFRLFLSYDCGCLIFTKHMQIYWKFESTWTCTIRSRSWIKLVYHRFIIYINISGPV